MAKMKLVSWALWATVALASSAAATDWPQLQQNAARTGRTPDSVAPPYRARWIWLGPGQTLRNQASNPAWPDNLVTSTSASYSYPMPATVNFNLAEAVQPVVAAGRVFVGTVEGDAYGIDANDGTTLWSQPISGGTWASAAVSESGNTVIFVTLSGLVVGLAPANGATRWTWDCKRALTAAPCVSGSNVYVADHGGTVTALAADTGALVWARPLPAPILGGLAADGTSVYVGAESMTVTALNISNGQIRAEHRVRGQSFRMLWPVVFNNRVWVSSMTTPRIGSEYAMEQLMTDSATFAAEETNIALWLQGLGGWADAGEDWKHVFALETSDLSEPFTILAGPADGCGTPTAPVVIDNSDRVLTYFKTRYPTFTTPLSGFGTAYSIDIAAVDQSNGRRIRIDNGHTCGLYPFETDNLYGLTVAGTRLMLRQNFRGTLQADLATSTGGRFQVQIRHWDGSDNTGTDIIYLDQPGPTGTPNSQMLGRVGPVVVGTRIYFCETYGITAVEHRP